MRISSITVPKNVLEKLARRNIYIDDICEVFNNRPEKRRDGIDPKSGKYKYFAHGRTDAGRFLRIVFIYMGNEPLVISAYEK